MKQAFEGGLSICSNDEQDYETTTQNKAKFSNRISPHLTRIITCQPPRIGYRLVQLSDFTTDIHFWIRHVLGYSPGVRTKEAA